jgi:hypothetical protein
LDPPELVSGTFYLAVDPADGKGGAGENYVASGFTIRSAPPPARGRSPDQVRGRRLP